MRDFFVKMHQTALISCVESILMPISNAKYHLTVARLRAYDTTIGESYDHADYLKLVLKEVYENDYDEIINRIKLCLGDLVVEEDVAMFFKVMTS